ERQLGGSGPGEPDGGRAPGAQEAAVPSRGGARVASPRPARRGAPLRPAGGSHGSLEIEHPTPEARVGSGLEGGRPDLLDAGERPASRVHRRRRRRGGREEQAGTARPSLPPPSVIPLLTGLGLAAAAGLNAWAVLLLFHGLVRLLPQEFPGVTTPFLASPFLLQLALVMFLAEFVVAKIP